MSETDPTLEDMRRVIREENKPVWELLKRHDRVIYGSNGTQGVTTELATTKRDVHEIKNTVQKMEDEVSDNSKARIRLYSLSGIGGVGGATGLWIWLKQLFQ